MRRILISLALIAVACIAGSSSAQDVLETRKDSVANVKFASKLQGTWQVVGLQKHGKVAERADLQGHRVLFREGRMVFTTADGDAAIFNFQLNLANDGRSVNLAPQGEKSKSLPGIIEFRDDTLRIAVNVAGGTRPASFQANGDLDISVIELRRSK
jgi:uncharacterized protein (TIGR03067 family)